MGTGVPNGSAGNVPGSSRSGSLEKRDLGLGIVAAFGGHTGNVPEGVGMAGIMWGVRDRTQGPSEMGRGQKPDGK